MHLETSDKKKEEFQICFCFAIEFVIYRSLNDVILNSLPRKLVKNGYNSTTQSTSIPVF